MKLKNLVKSVARSTIGKLPPSKKRLTGRLALNGGEPVRSMRWRPWPVYPHTSYYEWITSISPKIRKLIKNGEEGLPQKLAKEYSSKWAEYCKVRHSLLLPHGTDALRIGIAAALNHDGLSYGGEIIVPNISFVASATAASDRRIGVNLVDVDYDTLNLDPRRVEEAIVPGRTKAIMAVHLFGQPADMQSLREIAEKHSLALIEDAAQAHGAIHELGPVGGIGDVGAFSYQSFKNLSSGEGGSLTTNSEDIFERAYELHNVGRRLVGGLRWAHESLGWNCRPTEYIASVLLHRIDGLEAHQETRWKRFQLLRNLMADLDCVKPLGIGPGVLRHGVHMFAMRYDSTACGGLELSDFLKAVGAEGIPLYRAYEKTMAQQPVFQNIAKQNSEYVKFNDTPVADEVVKSLIYLPHQVFLSSESEIEEIAAAFYKVQAHYNQDPKIGVSKKLFDSKVEAQKRTESKKTTNITTKETVIRLGIVGAGYMGRQHAKVIEKVPGIKVECFVDQDLGCANEAAKQFMAKSYSSMEEMAVAGNLDTAVIATPHWLHSDQAIAAMKNGLNVICEKPLTVTVDQSDRLIEASKKYNKILAVVHQYRLEPSFQFAKQLIDSGEFGRVYRCSIVESAWRSEHYYQSSDWRGTWKGEGGGVLLNQAPHVLDRYIWLCGMPVSLSAYADTTLHDIEVEDTVSVILKHEDGLHGSIHVNTVESPAVSEMVICCDNGRIELDKGHVKVSKLEKSIHESTKSDNRMWGDLNSATQNHEFPYGDSMDSLLVEFYRKYLKSICGNGRLLSDGEDGRNVVELANAIMLSADTKAEISFPINRDNYKSFMDLKLTAK